MAFSARLFALLVFDTHLFIYYTKSNTVCVCVCVSEHLFVFDVVVTHNTMGLSDRFDKLSSERASRPAGRSGARQPVQIRQRNRSSSLGSQQQRGRNNRGGNNNKNKNNGRGRGRSRDRGRGRGRKNVPKRKSAPAKQQKAKKTKPNRPKSQPKNPDQLTNELADYFGGSEKTAAQAERIRGELEAKKKAEQEAKIAAKQAELDAQLANYQAAAPADAEATDTTETDTAETAETTDTTAPAADAEDSAEASLLC